MKTFRLGVFAIICLFQFSFATEDVISSSNDLLYKIINECFHKDYSTCIKLNVLNYFDDKSNDETSSRNMQSLNEVDSDDSSLNEESLDNKVLQRIQRYLMTHQFIIESPQYMKDAAIVYNPSQDPTDFNIVYKNEQQDEQAREMTGSPRQDDNKMVMPLVMLMKMKMKMMMPIMMMMIGMKATKALVLSKLAIVVVVVFIVMQMLSKKGMMPMNMTAMPTPAGTESATPPSSYGVVSMTTSSYDPAANWEANSGGPYSRVWDPHSSAYASYKPTYSASYSSGSASNVGAASNSYSSSY